MSATVLNYLVVFLLGATKFQVAFIIAPPIGLSYIETYILTLSGGLTGVVFFMFFSQFLVRFFSRFRAGLFKNKPKAETSKVKKSFSPRLRLLVKFIRRFGIAGIAAITPSVLSIPLGVFLAERVNARFIQNRKLVFVYMAVSVIFWSFIFSGLRYV
jgi:hypothetical protein